MNTQNANKNYQDSGEGSYPIFDLIVDESLSVRAKHVLRRLGVDNAESLLNLTKNELLSAKHCGKKTAGEILKLAKDIKAGKYGDAVKFAKRVSADKCFPAAMRDKAFNAVVGGLGCRASSLIERMGVETIDDFIYIRLLDMPEERGIGAVTIDEMQLMRSVVINFLKDCEEIDGTDRFYELCRRIFSETISSKRPWLLDPDKPCQSFLDWVATVADGRKKSKKSFLMRMGLNGQRATTLEQAGQRLGITRERVRQLNNEFKDTAKWIVHQLRFEPILQRMSGLAEDRGGRMEIDELLKEMAENGEAARKLSYAIPFLKYIASLQIGQEYGLRVDGYALVVDKE